MKFSADRSEGRRREGHEFFYRREEEFKQENSSFHPLHHHLRAAGNGRAALISWRRSSKLQQCLGKQLIRYLALPKMGRDFVNLQIPL